MKAVNPKHYRDFLTIPADVLENYRKDGEYVLGFEVLQKYLNDPEQYMTWLRGSA